MKVGGVKIARKDTALRQIIYGIREGEKKAMYDSYEMFYKGKIWQLIGILGVFTGVSFIFMGYWLYSDFEDMASMLIFYGVIALGGGIISFYHWLHYREKIDRNTYEQMVFVRECIALRNKKNEYLKALDKDDDYLVLKELYSHLPGLYNKYASEVINAPIHLTKPISPYTAGMLGTKIGGLAVGLVATQSAIEKQKAYEQNVRDVIISELNRGNAYDKAKYCVSSIEAIIAKNESARKDWEIEKYSIQAEYEKKYRVY